MTDQIAFRRLNHVEMIYRPGERELARKLFEVLGLKVVDRGGTWFTAHIDPQAPDHSNNVWYASEVTPEQWALELALAEALGSDSGHPVVTTAHAYLDRLRSEPQRSFHVGIRISDRSDYEATLDRLRSIADTDAELAGRVALLGVYHPDEPGVYVPNMIQAFVRTDIVAAGLLAFGQHIELQWHLLDGIGGPLTGSVAP